MTSALQTDWLDVLFSPQEAEDVWRAIFNKLEVLARDNLDPAALHRATLAPDRILAESAWDLWDLFPARSPRVIEELKRFWVAPAASGTAVLLLDGLSLRELPLLLCAAEPRGIAPTRVLVRGAEVPTQTDRFAAALGLSGRARLSNNQAPPGFLFTGPDVYTDVLDAPFADCVGSIPPTPRLFVWHTWPDDALIHLHADDQQGATRVAEEVRVQFAQDGFWELVNRLRQGRRLVITSDHGYATSRWFSSEMKEEEPIRLLRQTFGAKRCARENATLPWPNHHPPLACKHDGWLIVLGQRKWNVQGGFPNLCHDGLSLLEAAVPFIELPPL